MVGGGLSVGHGILETAFKESQEEASISEELMEKLVSAGSVSWVLIIWYIQYIFLYWWNTSNLV